MRHRAAIAALDTSTSAWFNARVVVIGARGAQPHANGAANMARKTHAKVAPVEVHEEPQVEALALSMGETIEDIDAQIEDDIVKPRSVVKVAYKVKCRDRAREAGIVRKAAKRSAWDWLAEQLAGECLRKKERIDIGHFLAILEANGVDHSKWQNRSKGWEGRHGPTGRLALQRVVAEAGELKLPDGEAVVAPTEWVAKYRS